MTNVLITTDFNDLSLNACLKFCKAMLKDSDTNYYLLHVKEDVGFFGRLLGQQGVSTDYQEFHFLELKKQIKTLYNLEVTPFIRKGRIASEINKFVNEHDIDAIVAGTSNTNLHAIGANTHKLIRTAEVPLITVNINMDPRPIKNILLPIELNLSSRQKIPYAIFCAKKYGAKIILLIGSWDKIDKDMDQHMEYTAVHTKEFVLNKGVDCEIVKMKPLNESKDFADETIKYMNNPENAVDLCIVMGRDLTTDYSADPRAQDIVRYAKMPVICCPLKNTGISTDFL